MGFLCDLLSDLSRGVWYFSGTSRDNNGNPGDDRGLHGHHVELLFRRYREKKTFSDTVDRSNGIVRICGHADILVRGVSHSRGVQSFIHPYGGRIDSNEFV